MDSMFAVTERAAYMTVGTAKHAQYALSNYTDQRKPELYHFNSGQNQLLFGHNMHHYVVCIVYEFGSVWRCRKNIRMTYTEMICFIVC